MHESLVVRNSPVNDRIALKNDNWAREALSNSVLPWKGLQVRQFNVEQLYKNSTILSKYPDKNFRAHSQRFPEFAVSKIKFVFVHISRTFRRVRLELFGNFSSFITFYIAPDVG